MSAPQYVLVYTWVEFGEPDTWAGPPGDLDTVTEAWQERASAVYTRAPSRPFYGPHTGNRVRVMTVEEWHRVRAALGGAS